MGLRSGVVLLLVGAALALGAADRAAAAVGASAADLPAVGRVCLGAAALTFVLHPLTARLRARGHRASASLDDVALPV